MFLNFNWNNWNWNASAILTYHFFISPSSAQSSSLATPEAYLMTLKPSSTFSDPYSHYRRDYGSPLTRLRLTLDEITARISLQFCLTLPRSFSFEQNKSHP